MPLAFPPRRCAELCAPAGDLVALDRGEHRLLEQHPRRAHRPGAAGVVAAGADRAEIETRAEMARTSGQDGDARVPVFRESREGFAKRECGEGIDRIALRSEEHTSELQSLMRISYAVFCLKKKK